MVHLVIQTYLLDQQLVPKTQSADLGDVPPHAVVRRSLAWIEKASCIQGTPPQQHYY